MLYDIASCFIAMYLYVPPFEWFLHEPAVWNAHLGQDVPYHITSHSVQGVHRGHFNVAANGIPKGAHKGAQHPGHDGPCRVALGPIDGAHEGDAFVLRRFVHCCSECPGSAPLPIFVPLLCFISVMTVFLFFLQMGASQSSADLDSEKAAWVKQQIDNACVVIFSKTTCPYCRMAKKVFSDIGQETNVIELNQRSDGGEIQDILYQMTGASTVSFSSILIGDKTILTGWVRVVNN